MNIAALTILLAQLTHGPFARVPVDQSMAFAVAPQGMLVAWSEIQPGRAYAVMHVGMVDFEANWISPIRTIAPLHNLHATSPAIATDGERFFVAWIDRTGSSWLPARVSGALVDAAGVPSSPTFDLGDATSGTPAIVWDGLFFRSFAWSSYTITPHGAIQRTASPAVGERVPFATPDANGWVDWKETPSRVHCGFNPAFCTRSQAVYSVDWAILSARGIHTGGVEELGYSAGRPAVVANGDDILVIWSDLAGLKAIPIVDGRFGRPFRANTAATDLAAAESLVVSGGGDIYGVPIVDGARFGEPFRIAATKRSETSPRVYLVGPNRYLVTWVVDIDRSNPYLAGTFVTIP